jgi:uncharacterized protein with HEPN domain
MPRDKGDAAFIYDILHAAADIQRFIAGKSLEDFQSDEMMGSAVERKIEVIGEAARGISEGFRLAHPEVPWKKIIATRNIVAHDYDSVNRTTVWRIATTHIPDLIRLLTPHLPEIPPDPSPES